MRSAVGAGGGGTRFPTEENPLAARISNFGRKPPSKGKGLRARFKLGSGNELQGKKEIPGTRDGSVPDCLGGNTAYRNSVELPY